MRSLKVWKAWLPVPALPKEARPSRRDAAWFRGVGVDRERLLGALAVLRCVRRDVVPALARLRQARHVEAVQFLIHDPPSGVTVPKGSLGCVDLTVRFVHKAHGVGAVLAGWQGVEPAAKVTEIAGVDVGKFQGGVLRAQRLIERQSAWYLDLVGSYPQDVPDAALLRQVGQFLHYFANMSQLVVA